MKTLARPRDTAEILARLKQLRPDSARRWGRMSAHQMVCHLGDACRMALGQKGVSPASGALQRTFLKWVALYVPMPWPAGVLTRPEIEQGRGGTCPTDFDADLAEVATLVEVLASQRAVVWPPHPVFGTLSEREWLRWGYRHLDHHLRQFGT